MSGNGSEFIFPSKNNHEHNRRGQFYPSGPLEEGARSDDQARESNPGEMKASEYHRYKNNT